MIYAIGLDSDPTFCYFLARSIWSGAAVRAINIRELVANGSWEFVLLEEGCATLVIDGAVVELDPSANYYLRPIDLGPVQHDEDIALRWRGFTVGLGSWLETCSGRVVNRLSAQSDNGTKPLHEYNLVTAGFDVPESITSADRTELAKFASGSRAIIKAISGVRSNTRHVSERHLLSLGSEGEPIHLQRYVAGADVRAHVVDEAVFAEIIRTPEVDYRDAGKSPVHFEQCELPPSLTRQLIDTTKQFGLSFAGWDFKLDEHGKFWCLEANPMPGYHGYDSRANGKITAALLAFLETGLSSAVDAPRLLCGRSRQ